MHADPATLPRVPRHPRRTSADRVREALETMGEGQARIASHCETAWASVTFAGARHRVELLFEGADGVEAGEHFIAALPDHEFAIPRQLVADAAVMEVDHRMLPQPRLAVSVELLVLEDA